MREASFHARSPLLVTAPGVLKIKMADGRLWFARKAWLFVEFLFSGSEHTPPAMTGITQQQCAPTMTSSVNF